VVLSGMEVPEICAAQQRSGIDECVRTLLGRAAGRGGSAGFPL
jgi:hypothetical protein